MKKQTKYMSILFIALAVILPSLNANSASLNAAEIDKKTNDIEQVRGNGANNDHGNVIENHHNQNKNDGIHNVKPEQESAYEGYSWHYSPSGWWYGNDITYRTKWAKINGTWFWFNKYGYANTHKGWEKSGGKWVYSLGSNGYYTNTTKKINGVYYYFDKNAFAHWK